MISCLGPIHAICIVDTRTIIIISYKVNWNQLYESSLTILLAMFGLELFSFVIPQVILNRLMPWKYKRDIVIKEQKKKDK